MDKRSAIEVHKHDFFEIAIVYSGTGVHSTPMGNYQLRHGTVLAIPPGNSHAYYKSGNLNVMNILFDSDHLKKLHDGLTVLPSFHALFRIDPIVRKMGKEQQILQLSPLCLKAVQLLIGNLETELRERSPGYRQMSLSLLRQIIIHICRDAATPDKTRFGIAAAVAMIESHPDRSYSLEDLAKASGMSIRQFIRLFRELLGHSPIDYLIRQRIKLACIMLENSKDKNITDIALDCGFNDSNYFSRQFRKHKNCSPRTWRERLLH